jgi:DNA invertase Pin-like site-specific DNA recombinase
MNFSKRRRRACCPANVAARRQPTGAELASFSQSHEIARPVDTGTAAGKAFLDMLGVFAEFETNLRRERQPEGTAQAKTRGVYPGRKPSIDMTEIRRLRDQDGLGATAIARRLGIGRASVYRALGVP